LTSSVEHGQPGAAGQGSPGPSIGPLYRGPLWGALIAYGNFLFRYRNAVFPAAMVLLFLGFRPVFAGGDLASDRWLDLLGVLIVLAGQAVRAAVIGLAYIKRGGLDKKVYAAHLVTDGLFAHSRNPIYVGNLLMVAGYLVVHNSPWVYLLGGGFFLISYRAIVAAEEQYLHGKFGPAYVAYSRDVPRWWIMPAGLGATFAQMTFNWRRVVIKDYSTFMTATITVLGLYAYEVYVAQGFEQGGGALAAIGGLALAVVLATLGIRALKKAKILTDKAPAAGPDAHSGSGDGA
jgi:protein-S-isoprenylcysteine O-methyltransferase Ste14